MAPSLRSRRRWSRRRGAACMHPAAARVRSADDEVSGARLAAARRRAGRAWSTRIVDAHAGGATPEQLGRALALAAGLRITRFHVQNDHGDWDVVHHGFTAANALHQSLDAGPVAGAAARCRARRHEGLSRPLPQRSRRPRCPPRRQATSRSPGVLGRAGPRRQSRRHRLRLRPRRRRSPSDAVATLGHALLAEDAEFHWFQTIEAAARQADGVAFRKRRGGPPARRRGPLPRRPHTDPT